MTNYHPSTHSVITAFEAVTDGTISYGVVISKEMCQLAAALDAAAETTDHDWSALECIDHLCAIAHELRGFK
ncbi:MAG: hypothetical protein EBW87_02610 [Burkholderiaceae bacterium]|nr:hypothetical protein [Burkholderiaceae bacterium]